MVMRNGIQSGEGIRSVGSININPFLPNGTKFGARSCRGTGIVVVREGNLFYEGTFSNGNFTRVYYPFESEVHTQILMLSVPQILIGERLHNGERQGFA